MISIRAFLVGVVSVCAVLIAFAVLMALAIYRLEKENATLRSSVKETVERLTHELEEHRKEERDRFFQAQQDVKLEGVRIRETIEKSSERSRP